MINSVQNQHKILNPLSTIRRTAEYFKTVSNVRFKYDQKTMFTSYVVHYDYVCVVKQ